MDNTELLKEIALQLRLANYLKIGREQSTMYILNGLEKKLTKKLEDEAN